MDPLFFVLLNQLTNLTPFLVQFEVVDHPRRFQQKLPPGKTRFFNQSRVLHRIKNWEPAGWKIRVKLDGQFTGIELDPKLMEHNVRFVFRFESKVLYVEGVKEILGCKDAVLRHRYFGCMRNYSWDHRKPIQLYRSDSESATKLRNLKGHCQHLAPFVDATSYQRSASPLNQSSAIPKIQENETNITERPPVEPVKTNGGPRPSSGAPVRREEQKGVQNDESSADPTKPSNSLLSRRMKDYYQARRIYDHDESSTETPKPSGQQESSGTAAGQQARLMDEESPTEPPKPFSRQVLRPWYVPRWYRTNGMATGQQARWSGDEYMVGVVLVCFARMVTVLKKILFRFRSSPV